MAILDLYHRPEPVLQRASHYLEKAIRLLHQKQEAMEAICATFTDALRQEGLEQFLSHTSSLTYRPELQYAVRPFLFGMDTNLSVTPWEGGSPVQVYCGILREPLQAMLASSRGPTYEVYHAIKLLGDRTRFDILCYLRDRKAYGQELGPLRPVPEYHSPPYEQTLGRPFGHLYGRRKPGVLHRGPGLSLRPSWTGSGSFCCLRPRPQKKAGSEISKNIWVCCKIALSKKK